MLPRTSRPAIAEHQGASARSLGLVGEDAESTATVSRQDAERDRHDDDDDLVATGKRSGLLGDASGADEDDSFETVTRGQRRVATDDEDLATPVGLLRLADSAPPGRAPSEPPASAERASFVRPMPGDVAEPASTPTPPRELPILAPDSARTRFAPIVAPPPRETPASPPATALAWPRSGDGAHPALVAPLPEVLMPSQQPPAPPRGVLRELQVLAERLGGGKLPIHRMALLGSSALLLLGAALFLVMRPSPPPEARDEGFPAAPTLVAPTELAPPVLVAPIVANATVIAPPGRTDPTPAPPPTTRERDREAPHAVHAPRPPRRRPAAIPVHREQ